MITVLVGDDTFEITKAVQRLADEWGGALERYDAESLSLRDLFSERRVVVIRDASRSAALWSSLPDWLPRVSDDIHLMFIEQKIDKRTITYKTVKELAALYEYTAWTERDAAKAEQWLVQAAKERHLELTPSLARHIVARVGTDKWQLASSLDKLELLDTISVETIDDSIDAQPSENVFELFDAALRKKPQRVADMLRTLAIQEDPYLVFGLLSSQAFQLAAVATAEKSANPAKDFAIHPYVVSKLEGHARSLGKRGALVLLERFAHTDADLKLSRAEPWLLIEQLLITIASS